MTTIACCGVDWGSSNFRLWSFSASGGLLSARANGDGAVGLKPEDFRPALGRILAEIGTSADTPVIVSGMAGSAQGWKEARYLDAPAALLDVVDQSVAVEGAGRDVRILPGVAQRNAAAPDVMRGEETQLLGAWISEKFEGAACMPGTHAKWLEVAGGRLQGFRTAMTGELFALLAGGSTLSAYAGGDSPPDTSSDAFADAVRHGLRSPDTLTRDLFSVRAGPLLDKAASAGARARLSGLLIGAELAAAPPSAGKVGLIASGAIAATYAQAFDIAGIAYQPMDGDRMAQAGLLAAARRIWPGRFEGANA